MTYFRLPPVWPRTVAILFRCRKMNTKVGQGRSLRSQSKEIVINVKNYFEKEKAANGLLRPSTQVIQRTADATGLGISTIKTLCKSESLSIEKGKPFVANSPCRKRLRFSPVTNLDSFTLDIIRRRIHDFYLNGELPTLEKLRKSLQSDEDVFSGCIESLRRIVTTQLGFKFCKVNKRKHLLERTDVVCLRHSFLQKMKNIDLTENVVFLDETWVNENHAVSSCWQSENVSGLKVPTGKGRRLIVLHAGTGKGFIPNCLLMFPSKSGLADYHADMNAEVFTTWFKEQLLPNIPSNCTIVMDNAPYHSVTLDKAPTTGSKKQDMIDWLHKHKIPFEATMLKAALYELVKEHKPRNKRYHIDELAASEPYCHTVVRLPPYHCQFNAIELIWAQIKGNVSARNTTFKLSDVKHLMEEAIISVTSENWMKAVRHTKKIMEEYSGKDCLIEEKIEPLIISVADSSNEDSDESRIFDDVSD